MGYTRDVSFGHIYGQEAAVATLKVALKRGAVPQSYLFLGPEGVGKTATARALIQTLLCLKPISDSADSACGTCINCKRVGEGTHPDVVQIAPDGETTKVWQLWNRPGHPAGALETLSFAPIAGKKRVYLFEKAETFNDESANSLLKALEEPPPYVQFILCAPSATAVLPTILSRCQQVRFSNVAAETIVTVLQKERSLSVGEARLLAAYSQGSLGRALRLADSPEQQTQRENLLNLAEKIARSPQIAAFRLAEELRNLSKGPKGAKGEDEDEVKGTRGELTRALEIIAAWFNDLLALALCGPTARIVHEERREAMTRLTQRYQTDQLIQNVQDILEFHQHIQRNANAQLATETLMLRLVAKK
jgi:DNA polymerase III subunit delta'